jgi:hypothetical protein
MSTMRKAMTGAAGLALAATSVLFSSSPASADVANLQLRNTNSGRCMAVPDSSTANGTVVVQWTCSNNNDQLWYAQQVSGNRYYLINQNSGKCLAIGSASTANGAKAIQWTCNGSSEQIWTRDSIGRLRNLNSDRCLAVPNSSTANGTELVQWTCTTNDDQQWWA